MATRTSPPSADWNDLARELDAWSNAGRSASLWWRDDDAVAPSPALDLLLELALTHDIGPALAVIPAAAAPILSEHLAGPAHRVDGLAVLQHGYAHKNHGLARKSELGPERPLTTRIEELRRGGQLLADLFGSRMLAVLVPPWNRLGDDVIAALPGIGILGLSRYNARPSALTAEGLRQANTHVDIVDWSARRFVGEAAALGLAVAHLAARRSGDADPDEPTGLLTHHLVHDDPCWQFMRRFFEQTRRHRAVRWMKPRDVFEVH